MTRREHNNAHPDSGPEALAATLLRQLHAVVTTGQAWDPVIAAGGTKGTDVPVAALPFASEAAAPADGGGEPDAGSRNTITPPHIQGSPPAAV